MKKAKDNPYKPGFKQYLQAGFWLLVLIGMFAIPIGGEQYYFNHHHFTSKTETEILSLPYGYKTENDSTLTPSETYITNGTNGTESVTYQVVFNNGKQSTKNVISKTILQEPTDQITHKGTATGLISNQPSPGSYRTGANCNDGTSSSATGSGACSHHNGVSEWIYN